MIRKLLIDRIVVDNLRPATPSKAFPAKASVGEVVLVSADVFTDVRDPLVVQVRWRCQGLGDDLWSSAPMSERGNDCWECPISFTSVGRHEVIVEAWVGATEGSGARSSPRVGGSASIAVWVDRPRALFSTWYEMFPRSEGGFVGARKRLGEIAAMGFDVVYLPPIHPIGISYRKGRNNTLSAGPDDVGSPWAIGSSEGGHDAIHPDLGNEDSFKELVDEAASLGMEIALDYALQCSPDHPWVSQHPEWFHHRADGTIKYAENPPKKYQDIYPLNFWPKRPKDRQALWQACRAIVEHWIGFGVRIFRVDNPHTKPMAFWAWLIESVQREHRDVIFLAEAFTRPKVMAKLAEVGFTQSYTYFTWRTSKDELASYLSEVSNGPSADWMRPNFWPNTPDILAEPLRHGNRASFRMRVLLASTMVPSYGIYSGYELCENEPESDANEEYLHSEKYEIKERDWNTDSSLSPFITRLNEIRKSHAALQQLRGTMVHHSNHPDVLAYSRFTFDRSDVVLCVVNLDPYHAHEDMITIDLESLGLPDNEAYEAHDEMTGTTYKWQGATNYVHLDPEIQPGHILHLRAAR